MLSLLTFGVSMWTVYGIMLREVPVIAANSATLVLVSIILVMKIRHG
jgi:MtN3 and saliva related transmembrane protein